LYDRTDDASGRITVTKTYYEYKNEKHVLHGQLIYTTQDEFPGAPLLSFRFTPAAKMKDREKYLARIADEGVLEPPPMEMKIDVKSDTLQKKN